MFFLYTILLIAAFAVFCSTQPVDVRPNHLFAPETTLKLRGASTLCLAETEADPHSLEIIRQGKYCLDEPFKKFVHCCYNKAGYTYSDGSIKISKAAKDYPDEYNITKVMEKCDFKIRNDPIETTFAFFRCFQDSSPVTINF